MHTIFLYATPSHIDSKNPVAIDIAAVRTDGSVGAKGGKRSSVLAACLTKVAIPKGTKVNASIYNPSDWIDGPTEDQAYKTLADNVLKPFTSEPFVIVTHHTDVLRVLVKSSFPVYDRIWIDLRSLAWPMVINGTLGSTKLDALCRHFKITYDPKMDAGDVCTVMVKMYTSIMRRYTTALMGEEIVSDLGGETFSKIRNFVGF